MRRLATPLRPASVVPQRMEAAEAVKSAIRSGGGCDAGRNSKATGSRHVCVCFTLQNYLPHIHELCTRMYVRGGHGVLLWCVLKVYTYGPSNNCRP